jgi:hypothetical protein
MMKRKDMRNRKTLHSARIKTVYAIVVKIDDGTFPRGNCSSKKMGTKIIKQDIGKHNFTMEYKSSVRQALNERETVSGWLNHRAWTLIPDLSPCRAAYPCGQTGMMR